MSANALLGRMRSAWGLLVAVAVMATVSTTLTALVPVYSTSIVDAGVRQALATADPEASAVVVTLRTTATETAELGRTAVDAADDVLAGSASGAVFAESGAYAIVGRDESVITSLATEIDGESFVVVDSVGTSDGGAAPVALHADAADFLGIGPGDAIDIERRGAVERILVTDIVRPIDAADPRWAGQPFGRDGVRISESFTELGPLFLDPDRFGTRDEPVSLIGRFVVATEEVTPGDLDDIVAGVVDARSTFATALDSSEVRVHTELDAVLGEIDTTVRTTGAVVGVILLQLVAVALYGLGVSAAVLARSRDAETDLLRSRGAGRRQLIGATLVEAVVVVVPAVVLGPVLAVVVVDLIGRWDPIEATGLQLRGSVTTVALIVTLAVAAAAVAVITVTAITTARSTSNRRDSILTRNGLDLVLIALAALGLWQLSRTGTVATGTTDSEASFDPVLALAPVLGVVAASLLALRLVGWAARVLLRLGERGRALLPALAGWDTVRRPARQTRTAVLIVVAVSIGVFAAVHADSWERSQRDQADTAIGSDIVVEPDVRANAAVAPRELPSAYRALSGVDGVLPVERRPADLGGELTTVSMVAVDADRLDDFVRLRADLRPDPSALAALAEPLDTQGAALDGTGDLTARVEVEAIGGDGGPYQPEIAVVTRDEFGTSERFAATVPTDLPPGQVTFGSVQPVTDGRTPTLVGIEVTVPALEIPLGTPAEDFPDPLVFTVTVSGVRAGDAAVAIGAAPWRMRDVSTDGSTTRPATAEIEPSGDGIRMVVDAGSNRRANLRVTARYTTADVEEGAIAQDVLEIPALATPGFVGRTGLGVGDTASMRLGGLRVTARIAGTAPVVPFAGDDRVALLVDRQTLTSIEFRTIGSTRVPDLWALEVTEAEHRAVGATLAAAPLASTSVADRRIEAERRSQDPVLVGLTGSLFAAVLAAAVVVLIGLVLTAVTEARDRRSGYAILRALGLHRSELRRLLVRETVPLAVLATACGVVAGMVLADLTVDSLTTDRDGRPALPVPDLVVPWPTIVGLVALTLVAVATLPLLTSRMLRRVRAADELRIGDQR